MKSGLFSAAIFAAGLVIGASGASAFQIVPADTNPDGTTKFADPDLRTQNLANPYQSRNGQTTMSFGHTTLQFGSTSSNSGPSPALQEKFLQSPASRTVPSQGW
jgi:hypothetical protein